MYDYHTGNLPQAFIDDYFVLISHKHSCNTIWHGFSAVKLDRGMARVEGSLPG